MSQDGHADGGQKPVASMDALPSFSFAPDGSQTFAATLRRVGPLIGLEQLGCMVIEVPPGKRGFPFHNHHRNEEMFVILSGEGRYRFGDAEHAVKAGDICAAPAGGPETAHQLINTGDAPLHYLAISTQADPEVVEYPDSGKFAAISIGAGRHFGTARLRYVGRPDTAVDYWDGEPD